MTSSGLIRFLTTICALQGWHQFIAGLTARIAFGGHICWARVGMVHSGQDRSDPFDNGGSRQEVNGMPDSDSDPILVEK